MFVTQRATVEAVEHLIGQKIKILDHGYIKLIDYLGDDNAVVQAARTSYQKGTKSASEDKGLLKYLLEHKHCYHPEMEVLTKNGWKRWEDLEKSEIFVVPNPTTNKLTLEKLEVREFDCEENLYCFTNSRMSYAVTKGHKMFFKQKYSKEWESVRVEDMSHWGHFQPQTGFTLTTSDNLNDLDVLRSYKMWEFIGFFLGDGCRASTNRLSFHLRKKRKIKYLSELLDILNITYSISPSSTHSDGLVFYVQTPRFISDYLDISLCTEEKELIVYPIDLSGFQSLFKGLVESDGHRKQNRPQIQFSSKSEELLKLFECCASMIGYSSKRTWDNIVTCYTDKTRTTLESREQYHFRQHHKGKVYCATSSTGWLMVRGNSKSIGFVCGNTTPFEMCEIKFEVKLPIFVARQWIRHRTANVNEMSARYSILDKEFYIPEGANMAMQSKSNKQGRGEVLDDIRKGNAQNRIKTAGETAYQDYEWLLGETAEGEEIEGIGLARELSRMVLPTNFYTRWFWKTDLHNLLHFLRLRMDKHAQYEIRVYADAIYEIVQQWVPGCAEAFENAVLNAVTFTGEEMKIIRELLAYGYQHPLSQSLEYVVNQRQKGWSGRRKLEFFDKLRVDQETIEDSRKCFKNLFTDEAWERISQ